MFIDNYIPGSGVENSGGLVERFQRREFHPNLQRPFLDSKGRVCVTVDTGRRETRRDQTGKLICNQDGTPVEFPVLRNVPVSEFQKQGIWNPVWNAASLRKDDWILLDKAVLTAARSRMRAWADLLEASPYTGFDGMSKMILEHEAMTDVGSAVVDMDGLSPSPGDSPLFQLEGLPLPITHSDFVISQRRLAVSRNSGTPLDTTMAEMAGRRVGEMIEKMTIGVENLSTLTYGKAADYGNAPGIYGYLTAPNRITKTDLTTPTGSNPDKTVADVLAMRDLAYAQNFYGPFMLYHSKDWDKYLDNDYYVLTTSGATAPTQTLRDRLRAIEGIQDVRRLDYLTTTFTLLLVQMTPEVCQAVNGMDITTVQWESKGGLQLHFKVMCIQVPRIRYQYVSGTTIKKTGIVHATTS